MKKQYKSSITNNHTIEKNTFVDGIPLKGYVTSKIIFRFCTRIKKSILGKIK